MLDEKIRNRLNQAQQIGITTHIRPDGDAIGSTLGLGLMLVAAGKKVQLVMRDGVSNTFRHLEGSQLVKRKFDSDCDLYIVLDCGDLKRTGGVLEGKTIGLVVDHHITNENFAELNYVEPESVATSAILAEKAQAWGLTVTRDAARALLTGIISDSIGFRTSNTTANSLRLAADLMDRGANITELYNKALLSRSYAATNYWGYALQRIQHEDKLVWTSLTLQDRKTSGYQGNDDADLINVLSSIDPLDIVVLFVEQKANLVKVSWRAKPGLDISQLAASFGGGGHPAASGAEINGSLEEVQDLVLRATKIYLEQIKINNQNDNSTDRLTLP
ncbi:MAG: bifunctional oligoribonuclease/PAP phosphatase NrnA [Anaerolineaceae bacterium]